MQSANPPSPFKRQFQLALLATVLAFVVITFGAYVRLSDAGLGCPDWPGCYGQLLVPSSEQAVSDANQTYPERPLHAGKAWREMLHRYLASALGLLILVLAALAIKHRRHAQQPLKLSLTLVLLVIFQGLLGMWTVTLLVKPAVVTAHLLGGLATVSLLWLLCLRLRRAERAPATSAQRPPSRGLWIATAIGTAITLGQIFLGGWTSTNYAALSCVEFPSCYGQQYWPESDFSEAFVLWREVGVDYEFGVLEPAARTAIHLSHRIGALVTLVYLLALAVLGWRAYRGSRLRGLFFVLLAATLLQVSLGITNVIGSLPLPVAVAHNGGAALLLLCLVSLLYAQFPRPMPSTAASPNSTLDR